METFSTEKMVEIDFIGIGAAKCATTWVYRCLLEHPQICGPYEKELDFFSTQDHPLFPGSENKKRILYSKGIDSYLEYFSHCPTGSIKGEFSTSYISDPGAAEKIKKYFPNAKIIAILRDPVKRAYSFFWFAKHFMMKENNDTFEEALKNNPKIYIDWGMYAKQLEPYFNLFPRENIGVFLVDDLKKDPIKFMGRIYEFLGASSSFVAPSTIKKENAASKVRFRFVRIMIDRSVDLLYNLHFRRLLGLLGRLGARKIIHFIHYKLNVSKIGKPELSTATEKYLRDLFRSDIEKLELMLEKNLSGWK